MKGGKGFILNEHQSRIHSRSFIGSTFNKWTPGILTNIKVLQRLSVINRLRPFYPFFLMVFGVRLQNVSFLMEAKRLRIPTIAFLNAYFGHWIVDYPILGNVSKRASLYYTYLFKEMRLSMRSLFLHRYVFRRSKNAYRRYYLGRSAITRESYLSDNLSIFKRHEKLLNNPMLIKLIQQGVNKSRIKALSSGSRVNKYVKKSKPYRRRKN